MRVCGEKGRVFSIIGESTEAEFRTYFPPPLSFCFDIGRTRGWNGARWEAEDTRGACVVTGVAPYRIARTAALSWDDGSRNNDSSAGFHEAAIPRGRALVVATLRGCARAHVALLAVVVVQLTRRTLAAHEDAPPGVSSQLSSDTRASRDGRVWCDRGVWYISSEERISLKERLRFRCPI